jgi:hypothetical protein
MSSGSFPGWISTFDFGSGSYILRCIRPDLKGLGRLTYHVPPGVSRRSNTRMVSNISSAANAAAAAAPKDTLADVIMLIGQRKHTGCPSTNNGNTAY